MALRIRRGTAAELAAITPADGELIYVTDNKALYVGDGATTGGKFLTSGSSLQQNLVLNGRDITGTGNINITGNIHATGSITADGSLTLGDSDTDNVVFAADINSSIVPNTTDTFNVGSSTKRWNNVYANQITAAVVGTDTTVHYGTLKGGVVAEDSSLIIDGFTGNIYGTLNGDVNGNVTGDLTGNVSGNVTGDVTGNLNGNAVGDASGTFTGVLKANNGTDILLTGTDGTDAVFLGKSFGELIGNVFPSNAGTQDSTIGLQPLVNGTDNSLNLNNTINTDLVPKVTATNSLGNFTTAFLDAHFDTTSRLFLGKVFNLTLSGSHIVAKGGISNSLPFTTTLVGDPSYSSTNELAVASVAGIQVGARFSMPGVTERTVTSKDGILNKIFTTESFTPSSSMDGGAHNGDSITFYNPGLPTPTVVATVPTTSKGVAGDVKGMIVASDTDFYYCFADYTNGTPDIWGKITFTSTSW